MEALLEKIEGKLYINGKYIASRSSKTLTIENPADGKLVTNKVPNANEEDLEVAVAAADAAFAPGSKWRSMTASGRSQCLWKLSELVREPEHVQAMALLDAHCFGRPVDETAKYDIPAASKGLQYFAGWPDKLAGRTFPAAGNVLIYKPSEKTPLSALYFADLFRVAGFPPGVLQVLTGDGRLGGLLASHMKIRKISFTGSVATGKKVQIAAAQSNLKRVTLELGGKSPLIVFKDANLDLAAGWAARTIASNCGQYCVASSRVYIQSEVYHEFLPKYLGILEMIAQGKGVPAEKGSSYGPVADKLQYDRVMGFIEAGKSEAKLLLGGDKMGEKGLYIHPTVFGDPAPNATVYKEEIFGPVSVVQMFETEEEVLKLANDSEFGLMAGVFTTNLSLAHRVAGGLEVGTVCLNSMSLVNPQTPLGGAKQSGYGSEGGRESLFDWTQTKTILMA